MQVRSTVAAAARMAAAVGLLALSGPAAASAATFTESTDAGPLPQTAMAVEGDGSLDAITGVIYGSTDQDLYAICLNGGKTFSATTTVGSAIADTQLFLFDEQGRGVYANDDAPSSTRSTLPAGHALTPDADGVYLLGISGYNDDPATAGFIRIFPDTLGPGVVGPADPNAVIGRWLASGSPSGAYRITLTGARMCGSAAPADTTAPAIEITTPADGAEYLLGSDVFVAFSCSDEDGGSGLASCVGDLASGARIDTSTVGEGSFQVKAADNAGNVAQLTHDYSVVYPYDGPYGPVDAYPAANTRKAGATVPYMFSLGGDRGPDPVVDVRSVAVECGSTAEPTGGVPADVGPVTYEDGVYRFNWKTDRAWSGTCRHLLVEIDDGTVHRAAFDFS